MRYLKLDAERLRRTKGHGVTSQHGPLTRTALARENRSIAYESDESALSQLAADTFLIFNAVHKFKQASIVFVSSVDPCAGRYFAEVMGEE